MGIDLSNSILIFDEAHNLPSTICDMESINITNSLSKMNDLLLFIRSYKNHRVFLQELDTVIQKLKLYFRGLLDSFGEELYILKNVDELLRESGLFQYNLTKIFSLLETISAELSHSSTVNFLIEIASLLSKVSSNSNDGKLIIEKQANDLTITYLKFDATSFMKSLPSNIHSILFMGGTLSPV